LKSEERSVKPSTLWLAVAATLMSTCFAIVLADSLARVGQTFPGFMVWDNGMLVAFQQNDWTGIRADMPTYGRVLEVDGVAYVDREDMFGRVAARPPGTPVVYRVSDREGATREITVESMRFELDQHLATFGVYAFGAAICWLTALAILFLRPGATDARALAAMLGAVGGTLLFAIDEIGTTRFAHLLFLFEPLTVVSVLYFALCFPRARLSPPRLRGLLTLGCAGAVIHGSIAIATFESDPGFSRGLNDLAYLSIAGALLIAVVMLGDALLRADSSADRVRAAIVFAGATAACVVPTVAVPAFFLLEWGVSWSGIFAPIFLFPLAVLYAVARHDLLGAERFIRLSLGYAIASALAVLIFSALIFILDLAFFPNLADGPGAALLFALVLVLTINPLVARVQHAIDRYFYRAVVDAGTVLETLGADLAEASDEASIKSLVESSLANALRVEWTELSTQMAGDPADLPMPEDGTRNEDGGLEQPVYFRDEQIGWIRCGAKRSGAPFAQADRDLMRGIAAQAGIALRNARSMEALRDAQATLVRQERLATMGELAGSVAHGVRNPLAGIRASAQLARQTATDADSREAMEGIITESDRLEQRVRALLDFSKPFQPHPGEHSLLELLRNVERAIAPGAQGSGVRLMVSVDPAQARIATDANFLEEALLELAGNAVRMMSTEGGTLTLEASVDERRAVLRVRDTGPGIPEEVRTRVFDLFFTTRRAGTGVGLATVKRIIEALGGVISLAPQQGVPPLGTCFEIELPFDAPAPDRARA
jgi:two-component system sensor histidine kinase HydH